MACWGNSPRKRSGPYCYPHNEPAWYVPQPERRFIWRGASNRRRIRATQARRARSFERPREQNLLRRAGSRVERRQVSHASNNPRCEPIVLHLSRQERVRDMKVASSARRLPGAVKMFEPALRAIAPSAPGQACNPDPWSFYILKSRATGIADGLAAGGQGEQISPRQAGKPVY